MKKRVPSPSHPPVVAREPIRTLLAVLLVVALFGPSHLHAQDKLYFYEPFNYPIETGVLFDKVPILVSGLIGSWRIPGFADKSIVKFEKDSLTFGESFPTQGGAVRLKTDAETAGSSIEAVMENELHGEVWHSFLFRLAQIPEDYSSQVFTEFSRHANSAAKAGNTGINIQNAPRPGVGYAGRPARHMATAESGAAIPADMPLEPDTVYLVISRFTRVGESLTQDAPGIATMWVFDAASFSQMLDHTAPDKLAESNLANSAIWTASNTAESINLDRIRESGFDRFQITNFRGMDSVFDEIRLGSSLRAVLP